MSNLQKAQEIYSMIGQGQLLEAFEKFYHQDVVMQEMGEAPRAGKDLNREYEVKFLSALAEVHGGGVDNMVSNEETGVVMIENWMDVTFKDGNRVKMEQVCVQQWKDGQIISEKFYHK